MFQVEFYQLPNGKEPVKEFLLKLKKAAVKSKSDRIRFEKMLTYIKVLEKYGTKAGYPYIRHITGTDLYELRPLRDRVFFFTFKDSKVVLLHQFVKRTQKTPAKEIDTAKKYMKDYLERGDSNGK